MNLEAEFIQSLKQRFPGVESQRILLAVSGGPDSIALLYLFIRFTKQIAVAHCNFGLRGAESDADEAFVKHCCSELNVPFYSKRFETSEEATEKSISIQVAARELRYAWFEQLRIEHHFDCIATAHHLDDNVETVLMNMLRGTGMKGLSGIPEQNGPIIRPLLFASKAQLIQFLSAHNIAYRNDASNAENKYTRNKLRNSIVPQLLELNPQASTHIHELSKHAQLAYALLSEKTEALASGNLSETNGTIQLHYDTISRTPFAAFYLFELISRYGFNKVQCDLIHANFCSAKTGTRFLSESFELIVDRHTLIINPRNDEQHPVADIVVHEQPSQVIALPDDEYMFNMLTNPSINTYLEDHLYINADLLSFPLYCRLWKQGDSFKPLGSNGSKKVSDLLIDQKVSLTAKRNTFVLQSSSGDIVAVLGHRIDNRYRITPDTRSVLHIYKKGDH